MKDKTLLLVCAAGLTLASFTVFGLSYLFKEAPQKPESSEISLKSVKGLQDCLMVAIETNDEKLYVVRCPSSDVSIHWVKDEKNYFTHTSESSHGS